MTATDHTKILGIIFLIFGVLGVLGIGFLLIFLLGMGGVAIFNTGANGDSIPIAVMFLIFAGFLVFTLLFIIPQLIAGWNLLKGNGRAKGWLMIAAIINILNFPLGTAIGAYALWFAFGDEGKRYFKN
jgi:hypothetical protein